MSERSLDEIMSERMPSVIEPDTGADPTPEPSAPEQPRDETGRFAPKQGESDAAAQAIVEGGEKPHPEPQGTVPQQALHAAREKIKLATDEADLLRRQNAELIAALTRQQPAQPAQPAPEPKPPISLWDDPDGFVAEKLTPLQQQAENEIVRTRMHFSYRDAVREYGAEGVAEAQAAFKAAVETGQIPKDRAAATLRRSIDPLGEIVSWHKQQQAMSEIGNDPAAYREKVRAELLAEMNPQPQPSPTPPQPAARPQLPTDFAGARSEGPRSGAVYSGPRPLSDITKGSAQ